jgi:hypothetical protein
LQSSASTNEFKFKIGNEVRATSPSLVRLNAQNKNTNPMPFPDLTWDLTIEEDRRQRIKLSRALRKYKRRKSILNTRFLSLWYKVLRKEEKEKLEGYDSQTGVKALASAGYQKLAES